MCVSQPKNIHTDQIDANEEKKREDNWILRVAAARTQHTMYRMHAWNIVYILILHSISDFGGTAIRCRRHRSSSALLFNLSTGAK